MIRLHCTAQPPVALRTRGSLFKLRRVQAAAYSPKENAKVIFFNQSEAEKQLYERLIEELKKQVERLEKENNFLKEMLKNGQK